MTRRGNSLSQIWKFPYIFREIVENPSQIVLTFALSNKRSLIPDSNLNCKPKSPE